jgi:hypothetical protein
MPCSTSSLVMVCTEQISFMKGIVLLHIMDVIAGTMRYEKGVMINSQAISDTTPPASLILALRKAMSRIQHKNNRIHTLPWQTQTAPSQ